MTASKAGMGAGGTKAGQTAYDREAMADCIEAVAARQDKAAFAVLFDYFAPRLKGYLMKLGSSDAQAEEVAQEVMITVWRKAGQFDRRQSSVSTWLYTIARNRRIDVLRREKFPDYDPDDPLLLPSEAEQPDEAVAASEREARVRDALTTLPEEQAELIRLAFFQGWSHSEIAENLDLPLGTVKSRLRLAFRKLKGGLDGAV
ncbi:sigma-70 family RNA polymerase sigma factor [Pyruvatibacter mobilis]|uniref:sigma-70 family RNA polymerase sigma factor n=1 Tax=Pyruvatibacter mobilis TaxID=1712261 RepID=UPI003D0A00C0